MDNNVDALLSMFSQLGTTDHEELIRQFQIIIPGTTQEVYNFFLSANNWVLANAISSYFDHNGNDHNGNDQNNNLNSKPNSCFQLQDDGADQYHPDTMFFKKWLVTNSGPIAWPNTSILKFTTGDQLGGPISIQAPPLPPNQTIDITIGFKSPSIPGDYAGSWQLSTSNDNSMLFGEPIWVVISVIPNPNQVQMGWGTLQPSMQSNQ